MSQIQDENALGGVRLRTKTFDAAPGERHTTCLRHGPTIPLMCFAGFAFAQEPDPHCDDPEMRAFDPKYKKNDGNVGHF